MLLAERLPSVRGIVASLGFPAIRARVGAPIIRISVCV